MSYILDAIRKADQKRKLGSVPDVNTVHEVPIVDPRRPAWVYGLAVILLLNAGLIGWWLWASRDGKAPTGKGAEKPPVQASLKGDTSPSSTPPRTEPTQAPPSTGAGVPVSPAAVPAQSPVGGPQPAAVSPPPASQPIAAPPASGVVGGSPAPAASPPAASVATPSPRPVMPPPAAVGSRPAPPATPAEAAKVVPMAKPGSPPPAAAVQAVEAQEESLVAPEEEEVLVQEQEEAEAQSLVPLAVSKPPASKAKAKHPGEEEDPELAKIPLWKQLPADVQQSIPELRLSFHAYSIKPDARMVSIGGKVLREGQEYEDGVTLETITPKGVVMSAKGRRFRLTMD